MTDIFQISSVKRSIFSAMVLLFAACAHHRDVRPGAMGQNRVLTRATDQEIASRDAISQARHFCEQYKQTPKIVSEKSNYTGEMNEDTRKTLRKASQAAILIGGMNTNPENPQLNPVLGAGQVGSVMTSGEDYQVEMVFECR